MDDCWLDFVSANECSLVVGIVNLEIITVHACIGVIGFGVLIEENVNGCVGFVGGNLTLAVVNEAINDFGEGNLFFCYTNGDRIGCKNFTRLVGNEADGEGSLTRIANSSLGIVKLPSTYYGIGQLNAAKLITVGRVHRGDRRDLRGIDSGKGHVFGDDFGNFFRPSRKDVTELFGGLHLFQFAGVQNVERFERFTVNFELDLVLYNYGNVERLSRIVEFEKLCTNFGGVNVSGYHRGIHLDYGSFAPLRAEKRNARKIHRFAISNDSVEIFTQIQLVSCTVVTCFVSAGSHNEQACKQHSNSGDTNDYS